MEEENKKTIRKKIFENLIIAIAMMIYFMLINFSYLRMDQNILLKIVNIASIVILFFSIIIFEIAYHKDSGRIGRWCPGNWKLKMKNNSLTFSI